MNLVRFASQITNRLNPFAKKCNKLISKRTNLPISELPNFKVPENAKTMDIVEISTPKGGHITITSFKNKNGSLVLRKILKKSKNKTQLTTRTYLGTNETHREVQSISETNGEKSQTEYSKIKYSKDTKTLYQEKLIVNYNKDNTTNEIQIFEQRKPEKFHHYIQTTASRNTNGEIETKGIKTNLLSQDEADKIGETPYLYAKNYSDKEFLAAIAPYAKERQEVSNRNISVIDKKLDKTNTGQSSIMTNEVFIDLSQMKSKEQIVETINHELRHQYQNMLIECLDKPSRGIQAKIILERTRHLQSQHKQKRILSDKEKKLAEEWAREQDNYVLYKTDMHKYLDQKTEKDAYKAGFLSSLEYNELICKIQNLLNFPPSMRITLEEIKKLGISYIN